MKVWLIYIHKKKPRLHFSESFTLTLVCGLTGCCCVTCWTVACFDFNTQDFSVDCRGANELSSHWSMCLPNGAPYFEAASCWDEELVRWEWNAACDQKLKRMSRRLDRRGNIFVTRFVNFKTRLLNGFIWLISVYDIFICWYQQSSDSVRMYSCDLGENDPFLEKHSAALAGSSMNK